MNLDDALKCLVDNLRPGMTVDAWMLGNGQMMRRVRMDDIDTEFFCVNDEEWAMAIQATANLVVLPYGMEEWTRKYPDSVRNDKETPNA